MHNVAITLHGADSAHRNRMKTHSSRIWAFPDGRNRVITMSGWHWAAYDAMISADPVNQSAEISLDTYELAQQEATLDLSLDFESTLLTIACELVRLSYYRNKNDETANNNGFMDQYRLIS